MGSEASAGTQPFSDPDESPAEASVLRMLLGAQLRRLAEVAEQPQVRLQVIPFSAGGHAGASGAFSVLRFREPDLPDVGLHRTAHRRHLPGPARRRGALPGSR